MILVLLYNLARQIPSSSNKNILIESLQKPLPFLNFEKVFIIQATGKNWSAQFYNLAVMGLWLPLNYQVDTGSSLAYDNGIWGEPYRLFAAKFLFFGVFFFWFVLKVVFVIGSAVDRLCGWFRDGLRG